MRWPHIRFTLLELILSPESPPDEQTPLYEGGCACGDYDIAVEPLEPEESWSPQYKFEERE